ncbi:MAG TPA: hypothetical protein VFQ38_15335 [Longimicrobiales bacterium]|nr:hypothetical protein [Longimicrobiales bacterium]
MGADETSDRKGPVGFVERLLGHGHIGQVAHRRHVPDFHRFLRRLGVNFAVSAAFMLFSLGLGTVGYHAIVGFRWIDALLNAAMLLGGMGPVGTITTTGGKLFAAAFALYSGLVFVIAAGLLLAPVFHRVLHHFHCEFEPSEGAGPGGAGASPERPA